MTKDTQPKAPKTLPTKSPQPSAGAYRAACQILDRQHLPGWSAEIYAEIIDRETGKARKRQSRAVKEKG